MSGSTSPARRRVAVIGSGVSGLTAGYVLRGSHEVTLFEAGERLGGHADTHDVRDPDGQNLAIDTGFIVHNTRTYPILIRLLDELGVPTQETDMSMSVRCDGCGLEYSGGQGLSGVIAQGRSLLRPDFLRMLAEVLRFHRQARAVLAGAEPTGVGPGEAPDDVTMAQFLRSGGYSAYFGAHFVTPLIAAVWSCGPQTALEYPARYLFAFLDNHGMLSLSGSPRWRTVVGGSRTYVRRAVKELTAVRTGTPIRAVERSDPTSSGAPIRIRDAADRIEEFDAVVIATHPDQALRLLATATAAEQAALGAFRYSTNPAVLHTDPSVLPLAPRARASWNYRMSTCSGGAEQVQVSYDMSRLQRLPGRQRYLVSLNAEAALAPERVLARMDYAHPQYTPQSVAAQSRLAALNDGVTAFAGAYHGWGFHEDGARAGLAAAISLGGAW
jgi:predicted NAD/FAD-binding protein